MCEKFENYYYIVINSTVTLIKTKVTSPACSYCSQHTWLFVNDEGAELITSALTYKVHDSIFTFSAYRLPATKTAYGTLNWNFTEN